MIDMDDTQFAGLLIIFIAFIVPVIYSFWVDDHKKGTPDPRENKF